MIAAGGGRRRAQLARRMKRMDRSRVSRLITDPVSISGLTGWLLGCRQAESPTGRTRVHGTSKPAALDQQGLRCRQSRVCHSDATAMPESPRRQCVGPEHGSCPAVGHLAMECRVSTLFAVSSLAGSESDRLRKGLDAGTAQTALALRDLPRPIQMSRATIAWFEQQGWQIVYRWSAQGGWFDSSTWEKA